MDVKESEGQNNSRSNLAENDEHEGIAGCFSGTVNLLKTIIGAGSYCLIDY